jgi:hypothetical protein
MKKTPVFLAMSQQQEKSQMNISHEHQTTYPPIWSRSPGGTEDVENAPY